MLPGKSDSFTFRRGITENGSNRSAGMQNCRRKLEDKFDDNQKNGSTHNDRSVLSVLSLNDNARKTLRNGAERLTKTFNTFRTSIGTFTQVFLSLILFVSKVYLVFVFRNSKYRQNVGKFWRKVQ